MPADVSAHTFIERLEAQSSPEQAKGYLGYFKTGEGAYGEGDMQSSTSTRRSERTTYA